jgi:hypothetical protein
VTKKLDPPGKDDGVSSGLGVKVVPKSSASNAGQKRSHSADEYRPIIAKKTLVECPICAMQVADVEINDHLDVMHP